MLDLENFETTFQRVISSTSFRKLLDKIKNANHIFLLGNGGNLAVCNHAACDLQQYLQDKTFYSFSDTVSLTALTSDHKYENALKEWCLSRVKNLRKQDILLIIVSTSGTAQNLRNITNHFEELELPYFIISTRNINESNTLSLDVNFYHNGELLTLALFYEIASQFGANLKRIN